MADRFVPRPRDYEDEKKPPKSRNYGVAKDHPLSDNWVDENVKQNSSIVKDNNKVAPKKTNTLRDDAKKRLTSQGFIDPLSMGFSDPLGATSDPLQSSQPSPEVKASPRAAAQSSPLTSRASPEDKEPKNAKNNINSNNNSSSNTPRNLNSDENSRDTPDLFMPWNTKKATILTEYQTDEKVSLTVSFMETGAEKQSQDTTAMRLASLEESKDAKEQKVGLKEYQDTIEGSHRDLRVAWNTEDRVKCLRIAIQVSKYLEQKHLNPIKSYPARWVMITEILDTFGRLVFDRLARRSLETSGQKSEVIEQKLFSGTFSPNEVSEQARETTRNWFYKIASIRELIPRLYVEMAILKSYAFIQNNTFHVVIDRICRQIRGIGDPVVAHYARAYLCRQGYQVAPHFKDYLTTCFNDMMFQQSFVLKTDETSLEKYKLNKEGYLRIFVPGFDWILQCLGFNSTRETFVTCLKKYNEILSPPVLKYLMTSFPSNVVANFATELLELITSADSTLFSPVQLYIAFGKVIVGGNPPKDQAGTYLSKVWKNVAKISNVDDYLQVAQVYIEYPAKHLTPSATNVMLGDILKHMRETNAFEKYQIELQDMLQKILKHYTDFSVIFGMDNFAGFLDFFVGETQIKVNKSLLKAFAQSSGTVTDITIINTMFQIAKTVHDSVNSLSFSDEIRQISEGISAFLHKVDFGLNFEKHLNFFVECRSAFSNLDAVKHQLVLSTCSLAMKTLRIVKGQHNKKTSEFVKGCIAFCYITIPSMDETIGRLNLYLLAGQVALMNKALGQVDALFTSAIYLIQDVPQFVESDGKSKPTEQQLVSFLNQFISTLVIIPGHPEKGAFYLIKGLIAILLQYEFESGKIIQAQIFSNLLALMASQSQVKLPYHIKGVVSNDELFGGSSDFEEELSTIVSKLVEELLNIITNLKQESEKDKNIEKALSKVALDVMNIFLAFSTINPKSASTCLTLWKLAQHSDHASYRKQTVSFLKEKKDPISQRLSEQFA